jgi:hypothetical protein
MNVEALLRKVLDEAEPDTVTPDTVTPTNQQVPDAAIMRLLARCVLYTHCQGYRDRAILSLMHTDHPHCRVVSGRGTVAQNLLVALGALGYLLLRDIHDMADEFFDATTHQNFILQECTEQ